jgi:hypothetical protein
VTYDEFLAEELMKHPLREFEDEEYSYAASQAFKRFSDQEENNELLPVRRLPHPGGTGRGQGERDLSAAAREPHRGDRGQPQQVLRSPVLTR